jgi:hypothetical protein
MALLSRLLLSENSFLTSNLVGSIDGITFEAFIIRKLVLHLWKGACVLMDNYGIHQYFGQFLIANRRIRVSRLQGKFATNGKSRVSDGELKTVRTIDS